MTATQLILSPSSPPTSPQEAEREEKVTGTFCVKHPKDRWRQEVPVTFSRVVLECME